MNLTARRLSFAFLCVAPLLATALTGARPLRVSGLYQTLGAAQFLAICLAAWQLGAWSIRADTQRRRQLANVGLLLLSPIALIALLWVGIGTPWDAAPAENRLRYLVLLAGSMAVSTAFVVLGAALREAGEHFYSTLGFAPNIFAGAAYLVWLSLHVGVYDVKVREGEILPAVTSLANVFDILLFVACVLTYITVATFSAAIGRMHWLGRGATRAYVVANLLALLFILMRGLSFPDPTAGTTPWYLQPGFVAGIPAVPWIMPFLLGVILLRHAGEESN